MIYRIYDIVNRTASREALQRLLEYWGVTAFHGDSPWFAFQHEMVYHILREPGRSRTGKATMNDVNEAIGLVWDVIRACDVDVEDVMVSVYDRETGDDAEYPFGEEMPEEDADNIGVSRDAMRAVVSLDPDFDYPENGNMSVDVELGQALITVNDPDDALDAVRAILDNDWMYDSANVQIIVTDQDSGRSATFDYGETITEDEVEQLYDTDELDDYDEVEGQLQDVVNLEGYELPGNMLVSVDLGRITVM